ncbi:MAG: hypothetical protein IKA58_03920, partial [Clostridia bacterium]|nr:hypothetical protein [Clostridia bacterium]
MKGTSARLGRIFLRYGVKIISLLLAVSIIAFALVSFSPVDPVQQYILGVGAVSPEQRAEIEEYWGVNEPPVQRYFNWLGALLRGDMGESLLYRRPVAEIIGERFVNSLALMLCAWLFSGIIGFALGCVMGMNRDGATAAILTITKIDATKFTSDACLDLGLLPSTVRGEEGLSAMYA